ncbi:MAG: HAMP domain-containing histidine kinase [Oscillospiraceae bacterium]|nr:HAMP domain-containing histidine kinase [Oscillospiraceae bacterium]
MKLKTFIATYLLFLCILYASLGIVSAYLTNSQTNILKEKSIGEYHSIAATLAKDIAVLRGRSSGEIDPVDTLVKGYIQYYRRHNIEIAVTDMTLDGFYGGDSGDSGGSDDESDSAGADDSSAYSDDDFVGIDDRSTVAEISFVRQVQGQEQGHFIHISGTLPEPLTFFRFDYSLDISNNITEMQNIQNTLLVFAVAFSVVTAIVLYFILTGIFKPLSIVAAASGNIADGRYGERLEVKGKNELASVAMSFNRMAGEIEKQIRILEDEAVGKQQFADSLAHEIRTPLTSIYGYAQYMQKAPLGEEEIIESTQRIMDEAGHMAKIADSLLDLATLRNYTPVKNKISIARLFDEISRTMEKPLREHNVQLVCNIEADALYGQEDLIKSMLINLCSNALQACAPGGGVISLGAVIKCSGEANRCEKVAITVADNGCGIPEDCIPKITEPFFRVDKARSREAGGAGLGLALCKHIADAHGADMAIESVVGEGTTVIITFTCS